MGAKAAAPETRRARARTTDFIFESVQTELASTREAEGAWANSQTNLESVELRRNTTKMQVRRIHNVTVQNA